MNTKTAGLLTLAILISFFAGFYLANTLNRSELEALKAAQNPPVNSPQNEAEKTLSDEEIRQRIAEADQNPDNLQAQRNLGMALYRYGAMKQDAKLLSEVSRLLLRVNQKDPADREVEITLGNLYFDIGYFAKDNKSFAKAREFYEKILAKSPDDVDVRTDYGLTFYLQEPPQYEKTIAEFEKVLRTNPKHEKSMRFLIQTLIKQQKMGEAEALLARLKDINPNTPSLSEIQTQLKLEENSSPQ